MGDGGIGGGAGIGDGAGMGGSGAGMDGSGGPRVLSRSTKSVAGGEAEVVAGVERVTSSTLQNAMRQIYSCMKNKSLAFTPDDNVKVLQYYVNNEKQLNYYWVPTKMCTFLVNNASQACSHGKQCSDYSLDHWFKFSHPDHDITHIANSMKYTVPANYESAANDCANDQRLQRLPMLAQLQWAAYASCIMDTLFSNSNGKTTLYRGVVLNTALEWGRKDYKTIITPSYTSTSSSVHKY